MSDRLGKIMKEENSIQTRVGDNDDVEEDEKKTSK